MADSGRLVIITGPMFAGKTTKLLKEMKKAQRMKKRVVLFKSAIDNRYGELEVVSHDGDRLPAAILPSGEECIRTLAKAAEKYDVIGVDEGHFWDATEGFAQALNELAFKSKSVYVSMLNRHSDDGNSFNVANELMPLADYVDFVKTKCARCGRRASFTQRITPYPILDGKVAYVGGKGDYEARCRTCFVPTPKSK